MSISRSIQAEVGFPPVEARAVRSQNLHRENVKVLSGYVFEVHCHARDSIRMESQATQHTRSKEPMGN